jgi:hypothetical protein
MFAGAAGITPVAFSLAISLIAFNLYSLLMAISYLNFFGLPNAKSVPKGETNQKMAKSA